MSIVTQKQNVHTATNKSLQVKEVIQDAEVQNFRIKEYLNTLQNQTDSINSILALRNRNNNTEKDEKDPIQVENLTQVEDPTRVNIKAIIAFRKLALEPNKNAKEIPQVNRVAVESDKNAEKVKKISQSRKRPRLLSEPATLRPGHIRKRAAEFGVEIVENSEKASKPYRRGTGCYEFQAEPLAFNLTIDDIIHQKKSSLQELAKKIINFITTSPVFRAIVAGGVIGAGIGAAIGFGAGALPGLILGVIFGPFVGAWLTGYIAQYNEQN